MTTTSPWFYGLLVPIVITVIAWPAVLVWYSNHPPAGGRGHAPTDWRAAGQTTRTRPQAVDPGGNEPGSHQPPPPTGAGTRPPAASGPHRSAPA